MTDAHLSPAASPGASTESEKGWRCTPLADGYDIRDEMSRTRFHTLSRAIQKLDGRTVVIKRLSRQSLGGRELELADALLQREAQTAGSLSHPNIVRLLDRCLDADGRYLVFEHTEDGFLRQYLNKHRTLPAEQALALIRDIVSTLVYAHELGVAHGSIRPENVVVMATWDRPVARLTGFGTTLPARPSTVSESESGEAAPAGNGGDETESIELTPDPADPRFSEYASPEQRRGPGQPTPSGDVYAVGKLLYEILSGESPDNVHPNRIPPPPPMADIIFKCIESRPADRYLDMQALLGDLSKLLPASADDTRTPPSPNPLSERYEVLEELGRGGFAVVHKARDRKLGRDVAIKRLLRKRLGGREADVTVDRFLRESMVIARLNHPNIVQIFDRGRDGDDDYIVMEYVAGGTLRDYRQARGCLPVKEAVRITRGVASGLAYAHRQTLVHRDIKPANILLALQSKVLVPKIVDFGLALVGGLMPPAAGGTAGSVASDALLLERSTLLDGQGGTGRRLLGTFEYMSPEQRYAPERATQASDVYSLGKVLYELVTGEVPDNVHPRRIPPVPGLQEIIFRCVERRPDDRYADMEALIEDLDRLEGAIGSASAGEGRAPQRPRPDDPPAADVHADEQLVREPPPDSPSSPVAAPAAEPSSLEPDTDSAASQEDTAVEDLHLAEAVQRVLAIMSANRLDEATVACNDYLNRRATGRACEPIQTLRDRDIPFLQMFRAFTHAADRRRYDLALASVRAIEEKAREFPDPNVPVPGSPLSPAMIRDALRRETVRITRIEREIEELMRLADAAENEGRLDDARRILLDIEERCPERPGTEASLLRLQDKHQARQEPFLQFKGHLAKAADMLGQKRLLTCRAQVAALRIMGATPQIAQAASRPDELDEARARLDALECRLSTEEQRIGALAPQVKTAFHAQEFEKCVDLAARARSITVEDLPFEETVKAARERLKEIDRLVLQGRQALTARRLKAARAACRQAADIQPTNAQVQSLVADVNAAWRRQWYRRAAALLTVLALALALSGINSFRTKQLKTAFAAALQAGDTTKAEALAARLQPLYPAIPDYLVARATCQQEYAQAAQKLLDEFGDEESKHVKGLFKLALRQEGHGRWEESAATWDKAKVQLRKAIRSANLLRWRREYQELLKQGQDAIAAKDWDTALTALDRASRVPLPAGPEQEAPMREATRQAQLGKALSVAEDARRRDDWEVVLRAASLALELEPGSARAASFADEARKALVPRIDIVSAIQGVEVPGAEVTINGVRQENRTPFMLPAEWGATYALRITLPPQGGHWPLVYEAVYKVTRMGRQTIKAELTDPPDLLVIQDPEPASLEGLAPGSDIAQAAQSQYAKEHSLPLEVELHKLGTRFRLIPPGSCLTLASAENGPNGSPPAREIRVTEPFYMARYEVTQKEWTQVMGNNPSEFAVSGEQAPVEKVSWTDCLAFARQLCSIVGVPAGTYRMPTEDEWEYACRAGTATAYYFGDSPTNLFRYGNYCDQSVLRPYSWRDTVYNDGFDKTAPAGSFRPNAWGLHDMHGNVWEWCSLRLAAAPAGPLPAEPQDGARAFQIRRGGSWIDAAENCRSSTRMEYAVSSRWQILGLRLVRRVP